MDATSADRGQIRGALRASAAGSMEVKWARCLLRPSPTSLSPETTAMLDQHRAQGGKVRTGVLLWALGVPIPIIIILWALKGCF